jgi:hypothetical protein
MTYEEYAAIKAHRASDVKQFVNSPRAYRVHMDAETKQDSDAMAFGRIVHVAVFEPDLLPLRASVWRGGKRMGKEWNEFVAAAGDKETIREVDYLRALKVRDAVHSHPAASKILASAGETEKTITWTDSETGAPCKARLDRLTTGGKSYIDDLKTTATIGDLRRFRRQSADLLYHMQLGMYRDGVRAALGADCGARIIAAETSGAFEVAVLEMSADELWAGSDIFHDNLAKIIECEKSGEWPFRYPEMVDLDLPPWAFGDGEDYECGAIVLRGAE